MQMVGVCVVVRGVILSKKDVENDKNRHGLFKSMPIGRCRATLFHIDVFDFVFVAVFQVFTSHTPDKSIVAGSGSSVDGPFGRSDGLFVCAAISNVLPAVRPSGDR